MVLRRDARMRTVDSVTRTLLGRQMSCTARYSLVSSPENVMNRTEFAEKLAKKAEISQAKARQILDVIFSTDPREGIIAVELDAGREVTITGFGTFTTRNRKAREGRNPQNGKPIKIAASIAPAFRAGKGLKDRVRK
jgi:DNA-binding protein HU-beta